jgi:hypothetical protein
LIITQVSDTQFASGEGAVSVVGDSAPWVHPSNEASKNTTQVASIADCHFLIPNLRKGEKSIL